MNVDSSVEYAALGRWRVRASNVPTRLFRELVDNEFLATNAAKAEQDAAIRHLLAYAQDRVPYYRREWRKNGIDGASVTGRGDLARLPILNARTIAANEARLVAEPLPEGEGVAARVRLRAEGTLAYVAVSRRVQLMNAVLAHRQARWLRLDPMSTFAEIREARFLPPHLDGNVAPSGAHIALAAWRYLGQFFHTGPHICLPAASPLLRQLEWLHRHEPATLFASGGTLRTLADEFTASATPGLTSPGLSHRTAMTSVGTLMSEALGWSPSAHESIADALDIPVGVSLGVNGLGRIAVRCEAGRFHVHRETTLVEVLDAEGQAVPDGAVGRIVVTTLANFVMPLIRFDTGLYAHAAAKACDCGRTLPGFGSLVRRRPGFDALPAGTQHRYYCLRGAIDRAAQGRPVAFHIHQTHPGDFDVLIQKEAREIQANAGAGTGAGPPVDLGRLEDFIRTEWASFHRNRPPNTPPPNLTIREVVSLPRDRGGPAPDFDSAALGARPETLTP